MHAAEAAPPARGAAERVAAYLGDLSGNPDEVYAAVQALDEAELEPFGLRACHLNLLALFGGRWPAGRVRDAAAGCARNRLWRGWDHNVRYRGSNLAVIGGATAGEATAHPSGPTLRGWQAERIAELRERGGVLVCGFHFGSYRFVCTDLAHLGFRTTLAVDSRTMEGSRRGTPGQVPGFDGRFRVARIDEPGGLVTLIRGLRAGVAYLNVDGNRGWGTGHADASHCTVEFLGQRLRVMTGAARIAAANGATLLPAAAIPDGRDPGRVVLGEPILPPAGPDDGFVARSMQALYDFFAPLVEAHPAEWQDVRFLHRWREPAPPAASGPDPTGERTSLLERRLAAGGALRLDPGRTLRLPHRDGGAVVDAHTLRTVRLPSWAAGLLDALDGPGVDSAWLRARFPDPGARGRALDLLAALHSHALLLPTSDTRIG